MVRRLSRGRNYPLTTLWLLAPLQLVHALDHYRVRYLGIPSIYD